jgi:hypothetical protein
MLGRTFFCSVAELSVQAAVMVARTATAKQADVLAMSRKNGFIFLSDICAINYD